jgi:endoglucanase
LSIGSVYSSYTTMRWLARITIPCGCLLGGLLAPAISHADAPFDPLGFHLASPVLFVHENAGQAVIEIDRIDASRPAQIRYDTEPITANKDYDFTRVRGMIPFAAGQRSATFAVPIVDHGLPGLPKTVKVALYGPWNEGIGVPSTAVLTIVNDDPAAIVRDLLNPLGLPTPPPPSDPLTGAQPFIPSEGLAANQARIWRTTHPRWAAMMDVIAREPEVHRWGNWTGPNPGIEVSQYLERAAMEEPGTVPEFATYWLVDSKLIQPHCGHYADTPARQAAYHQWIESLASGVGDYRAIMFLDMDSLIAVGCLSEQGVAIRMHELHDAIDILSQVPRLVVYLDAGAGDAVPAPQTAKMLREAGVSEIQGFFVNSTHMDWTKHEIKYGEEISRLTGGKHFVVNTAMNGQGPTRPRDRRHHGNENICDPPKAGLGPKPTFDPGFRNVDAFAWIANPGRSPGSCAPGAPPTGVWWPQRALQLVRHADFRVR